LYEYKAGFKRQPVWELEGGVKKWVDGMPDDLLSQQFPQTPPIFVKEKLVNDFFKQQAVREHEIMLANQMLEGADEESKEAILNTCFEQHFDECFPFIGKPCPYRILCFGNVEDPLNSGFEYRVPHHEKELEQQTNEGTEREERESNS
jgi:hypothetical protein